MVSNESALSTATNYLMEILPEHIEDSCEREDLEFFQEKQSDYQKHLRRLNSLDREMSALHISTPDEESWYNYLDSRRKDVLWHVDFWESYREELLQNPTLQRIANREHAKNGHSTPLFHIADDSENDIHSEACSTINCANTATMSFSFYKFCQNSFITILSAVFAMYFNLSISGSLPWWAGLLISIAATIIGLIPPLGIIHPVTYGIFILVALVKSVMDFSLFFWFILPVLILHIFRNVALLRFARKNPQTSLEYDIAIRNGF